MSIAVYRERIATLAEKMAISYVKNFLQKNAYENGIAGENLTKFYQDFGTYFGEKAANQLNFGLILISPREEIEKHLIEVVLENVTLPRDLYKRDPESKNISPSDPQE